MGRFGDFPGGYEGPSTALRGSFGRQSACTSGQLACPASAGCEVGVIIGGAGELDAEADGAGTLDAEENADGDCACDDGADLGHLALHRVR